MPIDTCWTSVQASCGIWQLAQEIVLSADNRGSKEEELSEFDFLDRERIVFGDVAVGVLQAKRHLQLVWRTDGSRRFGCLACGEGAVRRDEEPHPDRENLQPAWDDHARHILRYQNDP